MLRVQWNGLIWETNSSHKWKDSPTGLSLSQLNVTTSTHNMIVECVLKWEAGEKQQWSTFLLCSESVFPGRVTKLQSLEQFEEKIQNSIVKGNSVRLIPVVSKLLRKENDKIKQILVKTYTKRLNWTTWRTKAANRLTKAKFGSTQGSGSQLSRKRVLGST